MTWYLASAPLIPLSSLGYGAGGGAPEDGPSTPISKTWPDSGLLNPSLGQLTEVCPGLPRTPTQCQFTTQLPFSHTFCPNASPLKGAEIMEAFPMEDLEVSEFKCHEGIENILMGPWRVFFNMKSQPFRAALDNSPA